MVTSVNKLTSWLFGGKSWRSMTMIMNNEVCGGPALKFPGHLSFGQNIINRLRKNCRSGDGVAFIDGDTDHETTYKQILQETVNVATGLKLLGVKRGDVVGFCSENRVEFMTAAMGVICCGATVTTLNVKYSKDEITHVLNISRPSVIFGSEAGLKRNLNILKSLSYIKNIIQLNGTPVESGIAPYSSVMVETDAREYEPAAVQGWEDVVFILYSSGTTGLPKGVMLTHVNILYMAASLDYGYTHDSCSRFLMVLPWYHVYGLMTTIHYLTCNKLLVYLSEFNHEKYLSCIQKYKINCLFTVPPIVIFLAKSPFVDKYDMSSVNVIWCGGAALSAETTNEVLKRMPDCKVIRQLYGMTELTMAVVKDYDVFNASVKPGSCGYPIRGVTAKVVDVKTRQKLGANRQGEICLKGPIVMKGYMNDEVASRDILDDEGYLKTGDIGYYDDDGCFFIIDRLKELIKYKVYQVAPAAVERVLLQHSGVAECGVVGASDELAGELPTAFVVAKPGLALTETELLRFTDERLSPSSRLRGGVIIVNEIPKNASGKILRRELKKMLQQRSKSKL